MGIVDMCIHCDKTFYRSFLNHVNFKTLTLNFQIPFEKLILAISIEVIENVILYVTWLWIYYDKTFQTICFLLIDLDLKVSSTFWPMQPISWMQIITLSTY